MKTFVVLFFLIVAVSARLPKFDQCARYPTARIQFSQFPNPLSLRPGSRFQAKFQTFLKQKLPDTIYVNVELKKKVFIIWYRIPCEPTRDGNKFGSCDYKVTCDLLRQWSGKDKLDEPCPPNAGVSSRTIDMPIPTLSQSLRNKANGKYEVKIAMYTQPNRRGKLLGCVKTYIDVKAN